MLRRLNRSLNRRLDKHATRMLGGAHRPAPPNYLRDVCSAISLLIKSHKRLAKIMPEYFDYVEIDRRHRELEQERQRDAIIRPALDRIYGTTDQESQSPLSAGIQSGSDAEARPALRRPPKEGKQTVNKR